MTHIRGPAGLVLAGLLLVAAPSPGRAADAKELPSDLALVPPDASGFTTVRVADLAGSKAGKLLLEQLSQDKNSLVTHLERELGVPLADVERLTLLSAENVVIVRTTKPYDRAKLLAALVPAGKEQKFKGKTYSHDENAHTDLYLADDHVFVKSWAWGPEMSGLKQLWDRPAAKDAPLAEALHLAAEKHHLVAGVNPSALLVGFVAPEFAPGQGVKEGPPPGEPSPKPQDSPKTSPPKDAADPPPQPVAFPDERRPKPPSTEELLRQVPPEMLPYKPLLQARVATLVGDLGDEVKVEVRFTFPNKELARDGEVSVRVGLYVLRELLPQGLEEIAPAATRPKQLQAFVEQVQTALKTATVGEHGAVVSASAHMKVEPSAVATLAVQLRQAGQRRLIENNLRQLVLAAINHADANNGVLPAVASFDKAGKPLLSWRVHMLPYVGEAKLYKEFHLDEPWDSAHNKKLIAKMPQVFRGPNDKLNEQGKTVFLAPTGKGTAWPGGPTGLRFPASFQDGTSNTILLVLADDAHAVEWTRPADLPVDLRKPHAGLGQWGNSFVFGLADGSVHTTKATISKETLTAAFTPAGGEVLGSDW
jgi:hypothetical protein